MPHVPPPVPTAVTVPGIARRLLCILYESVLLTAVVFSATVAILGLLHALGVKLPRVALQLYVVVVVGFYFVPQWRAGQTLAMKTWRIRVEARDGGRLGYRTALMRYAYAWVSVLALGLGLLWALVDRDRQFLHDRLAGTRLVRRD